MLSPRRGGNLTYVGDDNSLYATYRQENTGATGEQRWANVIRENADTVVVVVEDDDLVQNGEVEHDAESTAPIVRCW